MKNSKQGAHFRKFSPLKSGNTRHAQNVLSAIVELKNEGGWTGLHIYKKYNREPDSFAYKLMKILQVATDKKNLMTIRNFVAIFNLRPLIEEGRVPTIGELNERKRTIKSKRENATRKKKKNYGPKQPAA